MSLVIEFKRKYKSLDDTIYWIVEQAKVGAPYMVQFPTFKNPCEIFNYFKKLVTFKYDPKGVELIQNPYTLLENNYHGISGAGDCDCFSTLIISYCMAKKIPCSILLFGKSKKSAQHISVDVNGVNVDLTNPKCDLIRPYNYYQKIPVIV